MNLFGTTTTIELILPNTAMATIPSAPGSTVESTPSAPTSATPPPTTAGITPTWDRRQYAAMSLVRPGLFLGNFAARRDEAALQAAGVTHVLSVLPVAPYELPPAPFEVVVVPINDFSTANLLDELDMCCAFISKARAGGGTVLVHCMAGISRSASVVAAYLMKTEHLSLPAALATIREARPIIDPNEGFIRQLGMYHSMGCQVTEEHAEYKAFKVEHLMLRLMSGGGLDSTQLSADPGAAPTATPTPPSPHNKSPDPVIIPPSLDQNGKSGSGGSRSASQYRCQKCRRVVVLAKHVVGHERGKGAKQFKGKKWAGGLGVVEPEDCSSLFVEPLQWMESVKGGDMEGKLECSKCALRLGSFNWSGMQCSCGAWVTPAFQLHKSKLDVDVR